MSRVRSRIFGALVAAGLLAACAPLATSNPTIDQLQDSAPSAAAVSTGAESLDALATDVSDLMDKANALLNGYAKEANANPEFKAFSDDTAGMSSTQAQGVFAALPAATQQQIKDFAASNPLTRKMAEVGELKTSAGELRQSFNHALDDMKTGKIKPEHYLKAMESTNLMRDQLGFVDNTVKFLQGQSSILDMLKQAPVGGATGSTGNETVYN